MAGSDVVLTIDANLQKVTEEALASNIQKIATGGFGKAYDITICDDQLIISEGSVMGHKMK